MSTNHGFTPPIRNPIDYSHLVVVLLSSLNGDCVTREYPVGWGRRRWRSAVELSELIFVLAEPVTLASDFKSLHSCGGEKGHNSKNPCARNSWNSFTGIEDDLLSIGHCQDRGPIAESVPVAEISVRRFIEVDRGCSNPVDDPQATVTDDTLSDRIGEESEAGC